MQFSVFALAALVPLVSAGGFIASCSSVSFSGSTLSATCINEGGGTGRTSLNLNNCLGNTNGELVCNG